MADENYNMMDDHSAPSTSKDASIANDTNDTKDDNKSDETEDQLALVPKHFFKSNMKPGDREMVEIVESYDGEYSIKCIYEDDKEGKEEGTEGESESESMSEDEAYV